MRGASTSAGRQAPPRPAGGKRRREERIAELARRKACLSCHGVDKRIVGPAFTEVAAKYKGDPGAQARLLEKLKRGGGGTWGPIPMPPNPDLSEADGKALVQWVLGGASLARERYNSRLHPAAAG